MSARDWVRALEWSQAARQAATPSLAAAVADIAARQPDAPALIGVDATLSYGGLSRLAHGYARWGLAEKLPPGAAVALLMQNCPDYVAIWLGLTEIGCRVALLNTNLAGPALAHGIASAGASHLIAAAALLGPARAAAGACSGLRCWSHGVTAETGWPRIDLAVAGLSGAALTPAEQRPPAARDCALLIYTSGTTGLPKATTITHARVLEWSGWFAGLIDAQPGDRLYDCLPLYHSTGGVVAIGCMLLAGGSVVIRERFSASRFWADVGATGCTIVQYIGELCRYLLQSPASPADTSHAVRLCCGNGLRYDVWPAFQRRFAIPRILEFYAATEGSVALYNLEGKPGAIGRVPAFLAHRLPVALIRCDPETGAVLRDPQGFCLRCEVDEPGEAIGAGRFDGYTDAAATARKLLHDVFAAGDCWFRSGDLMRRDAAGFFYFVDRLGDTFRWKGENVATTEVAAVLAACPGVIEAVVYGVAMPGAEGRAGMAALVVAPDFDFSELHCHVHAALPAYARPLFVRLCDQIETTGTFKLRKTALAAQGFAEAGNDPVWRDDGAGYVKPAEEEW